MHGYGSSDDHQPIFWLGGYGLYAAHLIVGGFVLSMVATALFMGFGSSSLLYPLIFDSSLVLRGQVWRIVTYGLYNEPSLSFAIHMVMMVWFGREVEKYLGRRSFLLLAVGTYLLTPLLFTAVGPWWPLTLHGETGSFAMFIAFATLYPNVPVFFSLLAKWAALILVTILSLIAFANRDHPGLLSLWATTTFAFGFIRYQQGHFKLPAFRFRRSAPRLRTLPDLKPTRRERASSASHPQSNVAASPATAESASASRESTMAEVDALLDKIAKSGLSSLTAKERAKLDHARHTLRKKRPERG